MIIRNERTNSGAWVRLGLWSVAIAGVVALAAYLIKGKTSPPPNEIWYSCDMENTRNEGDRVVFVGDGSSFQHGETQFKGISRSGSHSCQVSMTSEFGATFELGNLEAGEIFEATVWWKNESQLGTLVGDASWGYYNQGEFSGKRDASGWEQLILRIKVPPFVHDARLKFYVMNQDANPAYFDDLEIKRIKAEKPALGSLPLADSIPAINLIISDRGMEKLQRIRDEAMVRGVLKTEEGDWVNAKIEDGRKQFTGKVRLKGDWTDHLKGEKWSFRIALDAGQTWNRMVTFSVQSPETRSFLSEWVFHRWLDAEGLLSPRYEFIELRINGKSKGVYAYEEHFEKQLVEYKNRREGPILKYMEDGLWEVQEMKLANEGYSVEDRVPSYKSAEAIPFGAKQSLQDSAMKRQVEIAQQLAEQYRTGQKTIWEIFDADKMARYFAIVDVAKAHHGMIWHNQRWYYNPVISKMEPIGFDGYTAFGPLKWIDRPFIGYSRNVRYMAPNYRELMFERFFHDVKFVELYVRYLVKFSSDAYVEQFFRQIEPQLDQYERWIQREWPDYRFNRSAFFIEARAIRMILMPLKRNAIKAHFQGKTGAEYRYKVFNYHCLPAILLGVGKKEGQMDVVFRDQYMLEAYNNQFFPQFADAYSSAEGRFIFYKVPGIDSVFSAEIIPWEAPEGITPEQELFSDLNITSTDIYLVEEETKRVTFKRGKYKTDKDILIPKGYQVWFERGVELDLVKKAKFISRSQVLMFGTEDEPILITSSDQSANGFTILQSEGKSEFHYVVFDNLNTLQYKGWNLTGAVSLYESEVYINHCRFVRNHCEDALNLIRCVFNMTFSYVGNTFGDGFDADFCMGTVANCYFYKTGNDGMDFSGSKIYIISTEVDGAGDKGISLGEESTITVESATVRNSVVGLAAKDLTVATVKNIELYNNQQALTAYQKKPEYGPGEIVVEKYKAEGNKQLYVIQKGSKLKLGKELIEGKH